MFIFENSGTFGLLQNKLAKFRQWVVTQKRTNTILFRTEQASAPRKKKHRNKQRSEIYLFSTISMTSTSAQVNLDCLNHDIVEPKCSNYHKIHEIFLEISSFFAFLLLSERNGSAKKRAKQVYFLRKFWIIFIFLVNYRWHCTLKKL